MRNQPQIVVVARDRGGSYAVATQRALPEAIQVADRWHLMENASQAFLNAVRKSMRPIRAAIGATTITPALLTFAEKLRYEGYLRREETNTAILGLSRQGVAIKEIMRRTGYSRGLIRKILRGQRSDIFRTRRSSLEPYLPWLDEQWAAGCRNGAAELSLADLYLAPIVFYVSLTPDKDTVFDIDGFLDWWAKMQALQSFKDTQPKLG
jgi:transposase